LGTPAPGVAPLPLAGFHALDECDGVIEPSCRGVMLPCIGVCDPYAGVMAPAGAPAPPACGGGTRRISSPPALLVDPSLLRTTSLTRSTVIVLGIESSCTRAVVSVHSCTTPW
jgi:hypothetical protein